MLVVLNVINGSVYEHTARVSSYLSTLDCLEFTFSEGDRNWQRGPVLAAIIGLAGLILAVDQFFITGLPSAMQHCS